LRRSWGEAKFDDAPWDVSYADAMDINATNEDIKHK
jgi:hypothetical protein